MTSYLYTSHFPPSLAQCLQYLQFLQAWQGSEPVQVDEKDARGNTAAPSRRDNKSVMIEVRNCFVLRIAIPPMFKIYVSPTKSPELNAPVICEI